MLQMMASVTIGFVKDAKDHVNIQGFNVYHKNRLIKVIIVLSYTLMRFALKALSTLYVGWMLMSSSSFL